MLGAIRTVAIIAMLASTAHAGRPGELWRRRVHECPQMLDADRAFLQYENNAVVGIDRATGTTSRIQLPSSARSTGWTSIALAFDDTLVISTKRELLGVDAATGKLRWKRQPAVGDEDFAWSVRVRGDVVTSRMAGPDTARKLRVERLDAATGASRWSVDVPSPQHWMEHVVAGTAHLYVVVEVPRHGQPVHVHSILAIDLATGALAWSVPESVKELPDYVVAGDTLVEQLWDHGQSFAPATGAITTYRLPTHGSVKASGAWLYGTSGDAVVAFDAATGKIEWTSMMPNNDADLLGVPAGVPYVRDADQVRVLDPSSGAIRQSLGIARLTELRAHAGAPAITGCAGQDLVALDPTAAPEHTVTVSGDVSCALCDPSRALEVRLGDVRVTPDAKGHFTIVAKGRGTLEVLARYADFFGWAHLETIEMTSDRTVTVTALSTALPDFPPED